MSASEEEETVHVPRGRVVRQAEDENEQWKIHCINQAG
jgi:hypothetical protein